MKTIVSLEGVDIIQKNYQQVIIRGDGKEEFNQLINKEISLSPPSRNLEVVADSNHLFAKQSFDQWSLIYLVEQKYKDILKFISNINSKDEILASDYSYGQIYFEVTGENNAGIEDNESPKSLTKSAIFTTIDTDDSQITTLSTNLANVTSERDTLSGQVTELTTDLTEKQTEVEGLTTDKNILENQKESAVNTLDGFSDNIVNRINALKSALEQEEVTDNTLEQVNSLIGTFNNFVPNINSNTPGDTPVTQIQEFDRNIGEETEDGSQFNPSTFQTDENPTT